MKLRITLLIILCTLFIVNCDKNSNAHSNGKNEPIKKVKLRSTANKQLSPEEMEKMLYENGFFFIVINDTAPEFPNQYELIKNRKVVYDHCTDLFWQRSGSSNEMRYQNVQNYINYLNEKKFAGFQDWRLPTLEEAMSLMENVRSNNDLYIDPIFDSKQKSFYTSDMENELKAWIINLNIGTCGRSAINIYSEHVRAVRTSH